MSELIICSICQEEVPSDQFWDEGERCCRCAAGDFARGINSAYAAHERIVVKLEKENARLKKELKIYINSRNPYFNHHT